MNDTQKRLIMAFLLFAIPGFIVGHETSIHFGVSVWAFGIGIFVCTNKAKP